MKQELAYYLQQADEETLPRIFTSIGIIVADLAAFLVDTNKEGTAGTPLCNLKEKDVKGFSNRMKREPHWEKIIEVAKKVGSGEMQAATRDAAFPVVGSSPGNDGDDESSVGSDENIGSDRDPDDISVNSEHDSVDEWDEDDDDEDRDDEDQKDG